MPYLDFADMPVWKSALEVVENIYIITQQLPKQEDYALCGQLRRAPLSITGNIAEGFGRGHKKDKINFYLFARGSAYEVKSHLIAGKTVGYFSEGQLFSINERCNQIIEALNKLIKGLNNA